MSFNYSKLRGRIVEKFTSQRKFAEALGISERSLSLKLTNKVNWKQAEILLSCELLGITSDAMSVYFFTEEVQNF